MEKTIKRIRTKDAYGKPLFREITFDGLEEELSKGMTQPVFAMTEIKIKNERRWFWAIWESVEAMNLTEPECDWDVFKDVFKTKSETQTEIGEPIRSGYSRKSPYRGLKSFKGPSRRFKIINLSDSTAEPLLVTYQIPVKELYSSGKEACKVYLKQRDGKEKAARAKGKGIKNKDIVNMQFLYRHYRNVEFVGGVMKETYGTDKHRVIKITEKRICIERHPYEPVSEQEAWRQYMVGKDVYLDRIELELEGKVRCRTIGDFWKDAYFYLTPKHPKWMTSDDNPFDVLGLDDTCTINEIKAAYKEKCMTAHPDHGGTDDEFIILNEAYTLALKLGAHNDHKT